MQLIYTFPSPCPKDKLSFSIKASSRRASERMRLGVENPFIQTNNIRLRKQKIIILERLCDPETLHLVLQNGSFGSHVGDSAVGILGAGGLDDGLPHGPTLVHPRWVSGDSVHVPHGFDGFGSIQVLVEGL